MRYSGWIKWIMQSIRQVFYISDGTAITAEVLGHAVMSQFPVVDKQYHPAVYRK